MKQAETFLVLQAVCPHCEAISEVEWADSDEQELSEEICENLKCGKEFTYCHPENEYELTI